MLRTDPWHHHRTLRRATIIGVSAFFLITAPIALKRIDMSLRALQILFFGWMIFVLTMITLTYRVRCPRCGQKFYAKGTVYWQMATKCLHCGQKKYADVGAPTKSDGIGR
jgi:hypothetical protein